MTREHKFKDLFESMSLKELEYFKWYLREVRPDTAPGELTLLLDCYRHTEVFCKVFLAEKFTLPFSNVLHTEFFALLNDENQKYIAGEMARDTGKSTSLVAFVIQRLLFKKSFNIMWVSQTKEIAEPYICQISKELAENPMILTFFGNIIGNRLSRGTFATKFGGFISCRGSEQQFRGSQSELSSSRIDLLIGDDIEARDISDTMREKIWNVTNSDMLPAMTPDGRAVFTGNAVHTNTAIRRFGKMKRWTYFSIPICDMECNSNWPERHSSEDLKMEMEDLREDNSIEIFYIERLCNPLPPDHKRVFRPEYFPVYNETEEELNNRHMFNAVLVDLAKTQKEKSCDSAIVGVSIDPHLCNIYGRQIVAGKFSPSDTIRFMFDMVESLGANVLLVEGTSLELWAEERVKDERIKRGVHVLIKMQKAVGEKLDRIIHLQPLMVTGQFQWNRSCVDKIRAPLCTYPKITAKDIPDACANIVPLMKEFNIHLGKKSKRLGNQDDPNAYLKSIYKSQNMPKDFNLAAVSGGSDFLMEAGWMNLG